MNHAFVFVRFVSNGATTGHRGRHCDGNAHDVMSSEVELLRRMSLHHVTVTAYTVVLQHPRVARRDHDRLHGSP